MDNIILQGAIMGILFLLKGAIQKQAYFRPEDEKNCQLILGELNKLFPHLSMDNENLKRFCFHCLKTFSEQNPLLLYNKPLMSDLLANTNDLKLDYTRIRIGIDNKLDELIFQDYKKYYEKMKFNDLVKGNRNIQSKINFFETIRNFPKIFLNFP